MEQLGAIESAFAAIREKPGDVQLCSVLWISPEFSIYLNMTQIYSDNLHTSANTFNTAYNFFRSVNVYDVCHVF